MTNTLRSVAERRDAWCPVCGEGYADALGKCTRCGTDAVIAATAESIERTTPLNGVTDDTRVKLPDSPHTRRWLDATRSYAAALEEQAKAAEERTRAVQRDARNLADASEALHTLLDRLGVQKALALPTGAGTGKRPGPYRRVPGEWARSRSGEIFAACVKCGTTEHKHKARGYCGRCYVSSG